MFCALYERHYVPLLARIGLCIYVYMYVMNCIRKESNRKLSDKLHKTSGLFCKTSSYVPQRIVISCKPMRPVDMLGSKS